MYPHFVCFRDDETFELTNEHFRMRIHLLRRSLLATPVRPARMQEPKVHCNRLEILLY